MQQEKGPVTAKKATKAASAAPSKAGRKSLDDELDIEFAFGERQEVGGLAVLIGDGTYLNGRPFKYYS